MKTNYFFLKNTSLCKYDEKIWYSIQHTDTVSDDRIKYEFRAVWSQVAPSIKYIQ